MRDGGASSEEKMVEGKRRGRNIILKSVKIECAKRETVEVEKETTMVEDGRERRGEKGYIS